jgi:hypothetical protein
VIEIPTCAGLLTGNTSAAAASNAARINLMLCLVTIAATPEFMAHAR